MIEIKCVVDGCPNVFRTEEAVSPNFRYMCSGRACYGDDTLTHTREDQVRAVGRRYDPKADEADKDIHFQNHQFDRQLDNTTGADQSIEGDDRSDFDVPPIQTPEL